MEQDDGLLLHGVVHSESYLWAADRQTLVDFLGSDGVVEIPCDCGKVHHFEVAELPDADLDCECGKALIRYGGECGE